MEKKNTNEKKKKKKGKGNKQRTSGWWAVPGSWDLSPNCAAGRDITLIANHSL